MLRLDSGCPWTGCFEPCLSHARLLASRSPSQDELNAHSGSVMPVFGGMGSFNDYALWRNGQIIRCMETLTEAGGAVYESGLDLRRIDA
ncbi:DUF6966 domain-containing protein [Stenotrophomonas pavanii]|uniref:DUF6966 domain-containing protein n=1 Tax=Stenotrophomonas pavanii TaxID=487698 RepID=UPI0039C6AAF5